jgi:hypothetical protein
MAIDEVMNRATINFPGHLNLKNAERLLQYISENLPGNVHYFIENHNNFLYDREKRKSVKDRGTLKMSANFLDSKVALCFDTAQLEPWSKNTSYVSSMKFQVVPGWELSDYGRVFPLWDDVRKLVGEYFDKRMKKSKNK